MKKLIEALNIFLKYGDPERPTHCLSGTLLIKINPDDVSYEDEIKLEELGFRANNDVGNFYSYQFGSW